VLDGVGTRAMGVIFTHLGRTPSCLAQLSLGRTPSCLAQLSAMHAEVRAHSIVSGSVVGHACRGEDVFIRAIQACKIFRQLWSAFVWPAVASCGQLWPAVTSNGNVSTSCDSAWTAMHSVAMHALQSPMARCGMRDRPRTNTVSF
jgi:hypothetical protein